MTKPLLALICLAAQSLVSLPVNGQQAAAITVKIDPGAAQTLRPGIFSFAGTYTLGGLKPDDPTILRIMRTIRPPVLRVPGGDTMNYWDWNAGAVRTAEQMKQAGADPTAPKAAGVLKVRAQYLENMGGPMVAERWAKLAAEGGSEPMWGLNITTMSPEDTRQFMLHLKALKLPATRFELGNELSFGTLWAKMVPNAQAYVQKAKAHAQEVKAVFPNAKVAVVLASSLLKGGMAKAGEAPPAGAWSEALMKESFYDAVIVHSYTFTGELGNLKDLSADDYAHYAQVRSSAALLGNGLAYIGKMFPGKEIWLTEWSLNNRLYERAHPEQKYRPEHTVLSGLFTADFMLNAAAVPSNLTVANYWNIYGDQNFGLIGGTPPKERPSFHVLRMLSPAVHECDRIAALALPGIPRVRGPRQFSVLEAPQVTGFAFFKGSQLRYLAFVNFTERSYTLNVNAKGSGKAEWLTGAELLPAWSNPKNPGPAQWDPKYELRQADVKLDALTIEPRSFTVVRSF
jgi:hypothetical protein